MGMSQEHHKNTRGVLGSFAMRPFVIWCSNKYSKLNNCIYKKMELVVIIVIS